MTDGVQIALPWWARVLDALGLALLLIGFSIVVTGGFREWTPFGRISVTSWQRPVAIGAVALLVRHVVWRRPTIVVSRARDAESVARSRQEVRGVLPVFLATRIGVIIVGFLGIVMLGYAPNTPPWRVYNNEFLNLPARWDTGWYMVSRRRLQLASRRSRDSPAEHRILPGLPDADALRVALLRARQMMWMGVVDLVGRVLRGHDLPLSAGARASGRRRGGGGGRASRDAIRSRFSSAPPTPNRCFC